MKKDYQIEIERIHHSECFLIYRDSIGELKIWVDQSPYPEYDFVSAENYINASGERLHQVMKNIQEWAKANSLIIKIWKESELGV